MFTEKYDDLLSSPRKMAERTSVKALLFSLSAQFSNITSGWQISTPSCYQSKMKIVYCRDWESNPQGPISSTTNLL